MIVPKTARPPETADANHRVWILILILLAGLGAVVLRLAFWQFGQYSYIANIVEKANESAAPETRPVARGAILDRNGMPLAINTWRYIVSASPRGMGGEKQRQETIQHLALLLNRTPDWVRQKVAEIPGDKDYGVIDPDVSLDVGNHILQEGMPGITARLESSREYPAGSLASHVLGIVQARPAESRFAPGFYGLEQRYDDGLSGRSAACQSAVGYTPARLQIGVRDIQPSSTACDLVLTLDWAIQDMVERELAAGLERTKTVTGTVIVLEPSTGRILAMASRPGYDPGNLTRASMQFLANPAVSLTYEPGSVAKIMTMAAALNSGIVTPDSTMVDTGEMLVGGRTIRNWDRKAHGRVNMTECLALSLNVCSAYLSTSMGSATFYKYSDLFGYSKNTGIDLSLEVPGLVRTPAVKDWSVADLATNSYGQGMSATPLQVAMMAAIIANDGVPMKPYIVEKVLGQGQERVTQPTALPRAVSVDTARTLAGMLANAIEKENIPVQVPGIRVAGKTGTASIVNPLTGRYDDNLTIASFVGWAPLESPRFVVLVKLDRPQSSIFGSDTAGPIFREIARKLVTMMDVGSRAVNR